MENASKALTIAASVLIAIMILAALLLMFNNLDNYRNTGEENTRESQILQFNNQYSSYDRNNVRGSDIVSLINKISDYNKREVKSNNYAPMSMTIKIDLNKFKKGNTYDNQLRLFTATTYKESKTEQELQVKIAQAKQIENAHPSIKKLTEKISDIILTSEEETDIVKTKKRQDILTELGENLSDLTEVKKAVLTYYEYSQFNKSYFNCIDRYYDETTGRILSLDFEYIKTGI